MADIALAKPAGDVTEKVNAAVKDESLSISASNEMFGDTAPGVPKKLWVEYQAGDEKLSKEAEEGGRVHISAPAGRKLVILKAVYGPADGSTPAHAALLTDHPGEVLDTLPGFKVEHVLEADAPTQGSWICMANDPKGRLLLGGQSGLFSMLPLSPEQILKLRTDHGIYMAGSGRINVAGLTMGNIDKFIADVAAVSG